MDLLQKLCNQMVHYYAGDALRIQHFIKVHAYARWIGLNEQLAVDCLFTLEAAALVHDIGIHVSEEKYGDCNGKHQELEGPPIAREMMQTLGFDPAVIERVCYLIAHHHTYTDVVGLDYQILLEADFLVNLQEEQSSVPAIQSALQAIFKTDTGITLCHDLFGLEVMHD